MSTSVNKVILIGNCGQDPEARQTQSGNAVVNISLATSESWEDKKTGNRETRTEWHRVVFFGKLAEIVTQYVKKGSQLYIEGSLNTRKWQTSSGDDRYTTEIKAINMQMLDSSKQRDAPPPASAEDDQPNRQNESHFEDDNIPF